MMMIQNLWNRWKELPTWKKFLFVLPFILISVIGIVLVFLPDETKPVEDGISHNKKVVEEYLGHLAEEDKKLEDKQTEILKERVKLQKEVKENEKQAEDIIKRIDTADNDVDELLRIHTEINRFRAKHRRAG